MRQGQRLAANDHALAATTKELLGQRWPEAGLRPLHPRRASFGASTARTRPLPVWLSAEGVASLPVHRETSVRVVDDDGARDFVAQGTALVAAQLGAGDKAHAVGAGRRIR